MPLTREQRIRFGLTPEPPPAYEPLELDIVDKAAKRAGRQAGKIALVSTALTATLSVPLWILVDPVVAALFILVGGPWIHEAILGRWFARPK